MRLCLRLIVCAHLLLPGLGLQAAALRPPKHGAVTTVHPLATEAAEAICRQGGNAVDAAVAAGLTLGIVDGSNSGIGGGCFILISAPDGKLALVDGRETAPAAASRDMFLRDGKPDPAASQKGGLAVGVPGAFAAYEWACRRFGRVPFRIHLGNAAAIAKKGFPIPQAYAERLAQSASDLAADPGARAIFLHPDGTPLKAGELLVQHDLAASYIAGSERELDWFYRGDFASKVAGWMKGHGGLLTTNDFASYQLKFREPVRSSYRGHDLIGFSPPSSGGVHVAQILNILESFDLRSMGRDSADFIHVVAEAMRLAFADRAYWLGDPDFTHVPRGLVDTNYAASLAARIHRDRVTPVEGHGVPPEAGEDWYGKHTTHFCTVDSIGNWVSCTATINTTFGAKVVVPGTGVLLNNEMDDFSAAPGTANAFGLVGGEANAVAPGKRPLSSMSPTLVYHHQRPIMAVGAAGGPTIISQTVLAIIGVVDFGMPVADAVAAARFHHQWRPDQLTVEKKVGEGVVRDLEKRGHKVVVVDSIGACQAVGIAPGQFQAVADPRLEGKAVTW
ncbi:MAG TPA: gamma-glutamyltransferase [Verrucomicrobiales bacterium]|nr:gamma-glutamyltransferase [Verrucomicrobiales bacterium]